LYYSVNNGLTVPRIPPIVCEVVQNKDAGMPG
jgi:hypothetical protein